MKPLSLMKVLNLMKAQILMKALNLIKAQILMKALTKAVVTYTNPPISTTFNLNMAFTVLISK